MQVIAVYSMKGGVGKTSAQRVRKYLKQGEYDQQKLLPFFSMVDGRKRMHLHPAR